MPKILTDDVPMRTAVRELQLAEQLVEVPTIVSWSLLQLITKQNVDIPVPGRGGRISGLQGFPPGQSSTLRNAFLSGLWSRSLISPLLEAFKIFAQDRVPLHHLHLQLVFVVLQMGLLKGFFSHFSPKEKSAKIGPHLGSELGARLHFIHPGSSCGLVGGGGAS